MIYDEDVLQSDALFIPTEKISTSQAVTDSLSAGFDRLATNQLVEFSQNHADFLHSIPSFSLGSSIQERFDAQENNNPMLTEEEAKHSPYYRPDINVKGGIRLQNLIKSYNRRQKDDQLDFLISRAPDTFTAKAAVWASSTAEQFADPLTDLGYFFAPEILGASKLAPLMEGVKNPFMRLAARAGFGFGESTVFTSPSLIAEQLDDADLTSAQVLESIGMNAFFQVPLRIATGLKSVASKQNAKRILQTGVTQAYAGKMPRVDELIKASIYEERQTPNNGIIDTGIANNLENLIDDMTIKNVNPSIKSELKSKSVENLIDNGVDKKEIKNTEDKFYPRNPKQFLENVSKQTLDNLNNLSQKTNIEVLQSIDSVVEENQNNLKKFLNEQGINDEFLDANFLPKIFNDYFDDYYNLESSQLSKNTSNISNGKYPLYMETNGQNFVKGDIPYNVILDEQKIIENALGELGEDNNPISNQQIKALNKRAKELASLKKQYGSLSGAIEAYQNFGMRRRLIQRAIRNEEASLTQLKNTQDPLTKMDLEQVRSYINSYESDITNDTPAVKMYDRETQAIEDSIETQENMLAQIEKNLNSINLDKIEQNVVDTLNSEELQAKAAQKQLDTLVRCLMGED